MNFDITKALTDIGFERQFHKGNVFERPDGYIVEIIDRRGKVILIIKNSQKKRPHVATILAPIDANESKIMFKLLEIKSLQHV